MVDTPKPASATFNLDRRTAIGLGAGLLCVGILIGFKLAGGEPLIVEKEVPLFVQKSGPCAECKERELQRERAAEAAAKAWTQLPGEEVTTREERGIFTPPRDTPDTVTPGDSSVPE